MARSQARLSVHFGPSMLLSLAPHWRCQDMGGAHRGVALRTFASLVSWQHQAHKESLLFAVPRGVACAISVLF